MNIADKKTLFRLNNSPLFHQECEKVRERCKNVQVEVVKDEETGELFIKNYGIVDNLVFNEPYRIATMFGLPSEWAVSIRNHIISGKPLTVASTPSHFFFDKTTKRWEMYLPVHKADTKDSIKAKINKTTTQLSNRLLTEVESVKMDESDIYMLREYKKGRTAKEIGKALIIFNRVIDEESVRRRLTTLREQLGIPIRVKKSSKK